MKYMTLVVDHREADLIKQLGSKCVVQSPHVGDIHLIRVDGSPLMVIERKTVQDLSASIKDGRYKEQKIRLKKYAAETGCMIAYVIEGAHKDNWGKLVPESTILGAITSMMFRDHFYVYQSPGLNGTVEFLLKIQKNIAKYKLPSGPVAQTGGVSPPTYLESVKVRKRDNKTPEMTYLLQLRQIVGVSAAMAEVIAKEYPNMRALVSAYEAADTGDRAGLLAPLKGEGMSRKVGPAVSQRIYHTIFAAPEK